MVKGTFKHRANPATIVCVCKSTIYLSKLQKYSPLEQTKLPEQQSRSALTRAMSGL